MAGLWLLALRQEEAKGPASGYTPTKSVILQPGSLQNMLPHQSAPSKGSHAEDLGCQAPLNLALLRHGRQSSL